MVVTPAPRPPDLAFWAKQTPWSDPGEYVELIAEIEPTPAGVHEVVTNLIAHYRGHWDALPESTRDDVNLMRVSSRLRRDQQRHPGLAVGAPRELAARTQGCCRDHTLLGLAILRHHGIPARSRVGFASYFVPGWHHDHVVIEYQDGGRWVRFDPELPEEWDGLPHPHDLARSPGAYETAAEVWLASRRNGLDLSRYGVDPDVPALSGAWFAQGEVLLELSTDLAWKPYSGRASASWPDRTTTSTRIWSTRWPSCCCKATPGTVRRRHACSRCGARTSGYMPVSASARRTRWATDPRW